eukprot:TRINITY_DN15345_c0_g1_i5.p1 TRINITY_DN15345_c0_g1~~TRINITY_DN15345_c0_g1_i5.p1  ORF type:complete len:150 (-),score=5.22 TRINITY_DN15345_c0_g1_i5:287-736(-)
MLMKCRSKNRPNHSIAYGTLLLAMPASFSSASWPSNLALNMAEINVGHARSNLWAALPLTARHRSLAEVDPPTAFIYLHSATVQILWPRTIQLSGCIATILYGPLPVESLWSRRSHCTTSFGAEEVAAPARQHNTIDLTEHTGFGEPTA